LSRIALSYSMRRSASSGEATSSGVRNSAYVSYVISSFFFRIIKAMVGPISIAGPRYLPGCILVSGNTTETSQYFTN
jgi:hypothetical protein